MRSATGFTPKRRFRKSMPRRRRAGRCRPKRRIAAPVSPRFVTGTAPPIAAVKHGFYALRF